jgi:hypothetical protein
MRSVAGEDAANSTVPVAAPSLSVLRTIDLSRRRRERLSVQRKLYTFSALSRYNIRFSSSVIWKRNARYGSSKSQCG